MCWFLLPPRLQTSEVTARIELRSRSLINQTIVDSKSYFKTKTGICNGVSLSLRSSEGVAFVMFTRLQVNLIFCNFSRGISQDAVLIYEDSSVMVYDILLLIQDGVLQSWGFKPLG